VNHHSQSHENSADVDRRLQQLGLAQRALRLARERGLSASLECTPNHAPTAPGTYAYHETVRWLRDLLGPLGWTGDDAANRGLIVNDAGTRAIAVASGNEKTGQIDQIPSTRNPKGNTTVQAVRDNNNLWLFSEMEEDQATRLRANSIETWFLLIYRDDTTMEFRSELSLPVSIDGRLRPDLWRERIILEPISFDNTWSTNNPSGPTDSFDSGKSPEVTVEIRRRA